MEYVGLSVILLAVGYWFMKKARELEGDIKKENKFFDILIAIGMFGIGLLIMGAGLFILVILLFF